MPEFQGDPKEYRVFWEAFEVALGNKTKLSKTSKFTHRKKYLGGDAAIIRGLEFTEANYDEAVAILKKRTGHHSQIYGRFDTVGQSHQGNRHKEVASIIRPYSRGCPF